MLITELAAQDNRNMLDTSPNAFYLVREVSLHFDARLSLSYGRSQEASVCNSAPANFIILPCSP